MKNTIIKKTLKRSVGNYNRSLILAHYSKLQIAKKISCLLNKTSIIIINENKQPKILSKNLKEKIISSDLIIECLNSSFLGEFEEKLEKFILNKKKKLLLLIDWEKRHFNKKYFITNYEKIRNIGRKLLNQIKKIKIIEIEGKNIQINLKPKNIKWSLMDGKCKAGIVTQFPDGEICGYSNKMDINGYLEDKNIGFIKINRGIAYGKFPYKIKLAKIVEFGIGINPNLKGDEKIVSFDEKALNTIHLGIGKKEYHHDILVKNIKFKFDGNYVNLLKLFSKIK